ncbi:MAG: peptidase S51, partial [Dolichospermum sp.]
MTKAFPKILWHLQNAKNSLLRVVNQIIGHLTSQLRQLVKDIIADYQIPTPEPIYQLPKLSGPVHNLGGGGTDVDDAIQWMINQVRGGSNSDIKVNVLVIRAAGNDDYNQ